jgi:hypothetical protein
MFHPLAQTAAACASLSILLFSADSSTNGVHLIDIPLPKTMESVKKSGVKLPEFELLGTTVGLTFRKTARKINSLMYDS